TPQAQPWGIVTLDGINNHPLPDSADLSNYLPPVASQGMIGSCSAWSTVYYAKTIQENQERGWGAENPSRQFSPLFTYNQITDGENRGTSINNHMVLLQDIGAVPLSEFPYTRDISVQPDEETVERAATFKAASFRSLSHYNQENKNWTTDARDVKTVLAEGIPVVGGFTVYDNFYSYSGGVYSSAAGDIRGSHAMCIVGYNDSKQAFRVVNSWGEDWGEEGFIWISYGLFEELCTSGCLLMYDQRTSENFKLPAPSELSSSKGSRTNRIELSWAPVEHADYYSVLRVNNETGSFEEIGTPAEPHFTDTPLPPGVNYVYSVKSVEKQGSAQVYSELSEISEGWTGKEKTVPGIPGNFEYTFFREQPLLTWNSVENADGYNIYRWNADREEFIKIGRSPDTVFLDRSFSKPSDTSIFHYIVEASNGYGSGYATDTLSIAVNPEVRKPEKTVHHKSDSFSEEQIIEEPFDGEYFRSDYFDYEYTMARFREFYQAEQEAFRTFRENEQSEFEAWKTRQNPGNH
ncbi:MAG: hypothetical protein DRP70_15020, partial [Spirochaetes bacterium]